MARLNHLAVRGQQYALTHNWNFLLYQLPPGLNPKYNTLLGQNGVLNLHCETSGIPNAAVNLARGMIRGVQVQQPSQAIPDGMFVAMFYERSDYLISEFFDAWRQLGANRTTMIQMPKAQSTLFDGCQMDLLDGLGVKQVNYRPMNIYPMNCTITDLQPQGDIQRVNVDFTYTSFERVTNDLTSIGDIVSEVVNSII